MDNGLPKLEGEVTISKDLLYRVLYVMLHGDSVCEFDGDKLLGRMEIDPSLMLELYKLYYTGENIKK